MPDVAPMLPLGIDRGTCLLHGRSPVTDGGMPAQATRLHLPQHQRPGLSVDGQWTFGGPDRPAVEIDHIEVRPTPPAAIDFVQGNGPRGQWGVRRHPVQGTLFGLRNDGGDGPPADVLAGGGAQTGLNAADTGMPFDQQGQDLTLERGCEGGRSRRLSGGGF